MKLEEKRYIQKAIKDGAVYTTLIRPGERIPCTTAIKQGTIPEPWGHPQGDIEGIINYTETKKKRCFMPECTFKKEIKREIWHWFWLCVILAWGLMVCDIYDRQAAWNVRYQNWEYKTSPQEGTGFYDAMICPEKNP